nr:hypothetical protein [Tanacetum cinerariifolium]
MGYQKFDSFGSSSFKKDKGVENTNNITMIKDVDPLLDNITVQGVPRVGVPRPPRASMQDLYNRMGKMEIRQEAIERMKYRQSYHWDRYHGVFEHMVEVYSISLQGAYNPPGYA